MMDTPAEGTDLAALAARYVSVTPLRLDRTDEGFSDALTTTLKYGVIRASDARANVIQRESGFASSGAKAMFRMSSSSAKAEDPVRRDFAVN